MGTGLSGPNRQHSVEQAYSLTRPRPQIAASWHGNAKVGGELLEDIAQRGRERNPRRDRETQPNSVAGSGVGVLPDNEDLHLVKRIGKGPQDIATGGKIAVPGLDLPT